MTTGRPTRERSAEIETRILDAAKAIFLERGLGGASIDEIASLARAGKPTIYARYANKEALFVATVKRELLANMGHVQAEMPRDGEVEDRIRQIAAAVVHWALFGGAIGLLRLAISEAARLPELAGSVHKMARERGTEGVARLLSEVAASSELSSLPAFAPNHIARTTRMFLDLILLPLLLRVLFGEEPSSLGTEIDEHVRSRVAFFVEACKANASNSE